MSDRYDELGARLIAQLGHLDLLPVAPDPGATRNAETHFAARAIREAVAEEREMCARVAEDCDARAEGDHEGGEMACYIAAKIRERQP